MKEAPLYPGKDHNLKETPLSSVLAQIYSGSRRFERSPRDYIIAKTVTPDDLLVMSEIRIEVALVYDKESDNLLLLTGSEGSTTPEYPIRWYDFLVNREKVSAIEAAGKHGLAQQFGATVHVHNHPTTYLWLPLSPIGIPLNQEFPSPGGDQKIVEETNMDIAMIVSRAGVVLHSRDYYAKVTWEEQERLLLVCDVINGQKAWADVMSSIPSAKVG